MAKIIQDTDNFLGYKKEITKVVDITEDIKCEEKYFLIYTPNALRGGVTVISENGGQRPFFEIYDLQERGYPDRTCTYKKFITLAEKFGFSEEEFSTLLLEHSPK